MNKDAFHYYLYQGEDLINSQQKSFISGWVVCFSGNLTERENELLNKILQAVNASPDHVHKINMLEDSFSWENLKMAKILAFGTALPDTNAPQYQMNVKTNNNYILADKLDELGESVSLKQKLWKALKDLN